MRPRDLDPRTGTRARGDGPRARRRAGRVRAARARGARTRHPRDHPGDDAGLRRATGARGQRRLPPRASSPRSRAAGRRWLLLPAIGSLTAVFVALVVVFGPPRGCPTPRSPSRSSAAFRAGEPAPWLATPARSAAAEESPRRRRPGRSAAARPEPAASPPPSSSGPLAAARRPLDAPARMVRATRRSRSSPPPDDFDRTADAVNDGVGALPRIVASWRIVGRSERRRRDLDLRIPTLAWTARSRRWRSSAA